MFPNRAICSLRNLVCKADFIFGSVIFCEILLNSSASISALKLSLIVHASSRFPSTKINAFKFAIYIWLEVPTSRHLFDGSRAFNSFIRTCQPRGLDSPKTLNTMTINHSTFRWFKAIAYTTTLMDLPSSYLQHSTFYCRGWFLAHYE